MRPVPNVGELLDEWQSGDVVTLMTIGSDVDTVSASTRTQLDQMRERLRQAKPAGGIADLGLALSLAEDLLLPDRANRIELVTDGALQVNPVVAGDISAPISVNIVGERADPMPNAAVIAIGARPIVGEDDIQRLSFSIASFASEPIRLPFRVRADAVDVIADVIDLQPGETRVLEVTLPSGTTLADVVLEVRDALSVDNRAALLVGGNRGSGLDVLLISDTPDLLERALGALPEATVDVYPADTPGVQALAAGYDLTVFERVSPAAEDIPTTPMILVRPSAVGDRFAQAGVMSAPLIDQIDAGSALLDGVDLAGVTFGPTPAYVLAPDEVPRVRGAGNGLTGPLVWQGQLDDSPYVAYGFDLASSTIGQRVAFPILIARSVTAIVAPALPSALPMGESVMYQPATGTDHIVVTAPGGTVTRIAAPDSGGGVIIEPAAVAGQFTVQSVGQGEQVLSEASFMVNAGNPAESDIRPNPDLRTLLQGAAEGEVTTGEDRTLADLWPLLTTLVLAIVALEWIVAMGGQPRRWRLPFARTRTGGAA